MKYIKALKAHQVEDKISVNNARTTLELLCKRLFDVSDQRCTLLCKVTLKTGKLVNFMKIFIHPV